MTIFIETERLIIKAPSLSDLDDWCAVYAESDMKHYSKEVVMEWLNHHILEYKKYGFSICSVFLKDNDEFIGRAGLFCYVDIDSQKPDIEMGYIIHKKHWNKGYATEIAKALIDWGFTNLNITKLIALARIDNKKSQHILEKIGMHYVKQIHSEGEDFLFYEIYK